MILGKLTELHEAVKLSELAEQLQSTGIGLAAIRSLLASNPDRFAYAERRWVPAARIEAEGRPAYEAIRLLVDRFGGPMPIRLVAKEFAYVRGMDEEQGLELVRRIAVSSDVCFITDRDEVALSDWVFVQGPHETLDRALAVNGFTTEQVNEAASKIAKLNLRDASSVAEALKVTAPINTKLLGAAIATVLYDVDPHAAQFYDWKAYGAAILSVEGYEFDGAGNLAAESDAKKWITSAVKFAERIAPLVEIEDAAPIEVKKEDVSTIVKRVVGSEDSISAIKLLEEMFEITPSVKTFPDDLANLMAALKSEQDIVWVGGDRFRKATTLPDYVETIPEIFQYEQTEFTDDEGELIDAELNDEGLSSTLRKLLTHPLATDVLDEDILPAPKQYQDTIRLVLKPIHRELGTFPLCQFPTGWLDATPDIQELLLIDENGRELQAWANMKERLIFGLVDWFYEQPVESGAVFSLVKTPKPNVLEFHWLDQTDPVVFITSQRMEELREIAGSAAEMPTLSILQAVMAHWPKGADFLTILWEMNVIRRCSRRLVASLLSSYACFYQRSGSPVWHYDAKKVEQGFDKTKRKFVVKR